MLQNDATFWRLIDLLWISVSVTAPSSMNARRRVRSIGLVWERLIAATLLSWRVSVATGHQQGRAAAIDRIAVLAIASVTIRRVLLYVMGLKTAPLV